MMDKSRFPVAVCLLTLVGFASNAFAQGERGAITGVVKDSSGAVVPNAEVVALNKATGGENRAISTDSGVYRLPYLNPATYSLSASLKGFKTAVRDNVEVRVAQTVTVDFTLELGESFRANHGFRGDPAFGELNLRDWHRNH